MSKIVIVESAEDFLRKGFGKAKVVQNYAVGKSQITNNVNKKFNITFLKSDLIDTGFTYQEKSVIRIDPISQTSMSAFKKDLQAHFVPGGVYTDHYVSIDKPEAVDTVEELETNKTITSYGITSTFNYLSLQYDKDSEIASELSMPSILDYKAKVEYLDYKRNQKGSPLYSSQEYGNMEKFVIPIFGKNKVLGLNCSDRKSNYPYYNEIQITDKISNKFTSFMNKTDMFEPFLGDYLATSKFGKQMNVQDGNVVNKDMTIPIYFVNNWSLSNDINTTGDLGINSSTQDQSKMIIDYKKMLFSGYLKALSKLNFRSYKDIVLNNAECYKENFLYTIKKYKDGSLSTPLQEFYIPAVKDHTSYTDTQVKYGQKYIYKCESHYIIVGNKYKYEKLQYHGTGDQFYASVTVSNEPSVVMVALDTFSDATRVSQYPPIFPQVKFVSEINSQSKVDVYLSPTKGEIKQKFIRLSAKDDIQVSNMNLNYGSVVDKNGLVTFKTIEEQGNYEVYKVNYPPESLEDFKDKKMTDVKMDFYTNDAIFRDCVKPNDEHNYFMFRKISAKGLVSNPSPIYKVKLLIDADDSTLFVSEYKIPEKIKSQKAIKFRRFFQITPSVDQVMYDPNQEVLSDKKSLQGMIDELRFGWADKLVWGKKFKFRIKSTTSGKIIDYNIAFKLSKKKTEADFN